MFNNTSVSSSLDFFLQCGDCLQVFQDKKDADAHKTNNKCAQKIVEGGICSICYNRFNTVKQCLQHFQQCLKLKGKQGAKFSCSLCKKLFLSRNSCMKHLKSKKCNTKLSKTIFQCSSCSLEFTKKCALVRHINQNVCTNPKNQKCFVEGCDTYFRKNEHLAEHIERVHGNNIIFEGSGKKWEVENIKFTSRNDFQLWLISVSNEYNCNYFTSVVKKTNNVTYTNYKCQYDKKNRCNFKSKKSLPNLKCPSQVCCKTIGDQVMVTYYKTHNHEALSIKRHRIDYSRKMRSPSETVKHFIENANFSDDGLQMQSESKINDNTEILIKSEITNTFDTEHTQIENCGFLEIHKGTKEPTKSTYPMAINHVGIEDESKDFFEFSRDESENKADENSNQLCKVDSQYCNRSLKLDISQMFSNILEYVESTDDSDLLIQVKSQLTNVLNECIKVAIKIK